MKQEIFPIKLKKNSILFPNKTLSVFNDKKNLNDTLSFSQLYQEIIVASRSLQERYSSGDRVLLMLNTSLEFVILFCACLHSKIIPIPLPIPRRNRKFDLLIGVIKDSNPVAIISDTHTTELLNEILKPYFEESKPILINVFNFLEKKKDNFSLKDLEILPKDIAFIQYTSGSTGRPKGVIISHENLISNLNEIKRKFEHSNHSEGLIWLPLYHNMGLVGGVLQPLYVGFNIILMSPLSFISKPLRWLQMISKYKITTSGGPNFAYDLCVEQIKDEDLKSLDLTTLDVAFIGSEPISYGTLKSFYEKFKSCGFKMESFYPSYGLSESTLMVSGGSKKEKPVIKYRCDFNYSNSKQNVALDQTTNKNKKIILSSGNVLDSSHDIVIVSPETLTKSKNGIIGEIWVSGPSISRGYWNGNPEINSAFNSQIKGDDSHKKYFKTGDMGFIEQGELYITGRLKELIIIDGKNYFPHDIESALKNSHQALWRDKQVSFSIEGNDGKEHLIVLSEINSSWLKKDLLIVLKAIRRQLIENFDIQAKVILLLPPGSLPLTDSGKIQRAQSKLFYLQNNFKSINDAYAEIKN